MVVINGMIKNNNKDQVFFIYYFALVGRRLAPSLTVLSVCMCECERACLCDLIPLSVPAHRGCGLLCLGTPMTTKTAEAVLFSPAPASHLSLSKSQVN